MIERSIPLRTWIFRSISCVLCAGCASEKEEVGDGGAPVLKMVASLQENHGGAALWKRHAAVRFSYRIFLPGRQEGITFSQVAFRLDDYRRLWVLLPGGSKLRALSLEGAPGTAFGGAFEEDDSGGGAKARPGLDARESLAADFALRSIRYFFDLPLASSVGRWEFRGLLVPDDVTAPRWMEIAPREPAAPVSACLLLTNEKDGLLSKVAYSSLHPFASSGVHMLALDGYMDLGGIKVACRRTHTRSLPDASGGPPDLPSRGERRASEREWVLREEVGDIAFLGLEEANRELQDDP